MSLQPGHWCLEAEERAGATVIRFAGRSVRLGEQHLQIVDEQLASLARNLGRREIQLDFGNVECLATTALGRLVKLHKRVQAEGGRLSLCGVSPHIYEVFEITQLTNLFDIRRLDEVPAGGEEVAAPEADTL
ncbi:MAG TPA: STAS domain-containing protein [Gemmataceae bacterium]|jgi:anti-sigma B factor antagonist|nr:STAS domain-containing protein [Gemmataceae bacterium]